MPSPSKELISASQEASKKYGIPASVILAFAGGETSFGTAGMGKSKNNLFGIGNKSYSNVSESVDDFARLVTGHKDSTQSKKYGNAIKNANSPKEYVTAIRNAGYNSENPNYVGLIMGAYDTYNLKQYDVSFNKNVSVTEDDSSPSNNNGFLEGIAKSIMTVSFVVVLIFLAILFLVNAFSSPSQIVKKVKGAKA